MVDLNTYVPMIDAILSASDPDEVTPKRIRKALQELFGVNLDSYRKDINQLIIQRFEESKQRPKQLVSKEELLKKDEMLASKLQALAKRTKGAKTSTSKTKKKKKNGNNNDGPANPNALNSRKVSISEPLSGFLGESSLPRTQVVKLVWDYIKNHNLQNPEDRREIICDERMKPIFGDKMTMFSLNKILSKYLSKSDEIAVKKSASSPDNSIPPSKNEEEESGHIWEE